MIGCSAQGRMFPAGVTFGLQILQKNFMCRCISDNRGTYFCTQTGTGCYEQKFKNGDTYEVQDGLDHYSCVCVTGETHQVVCTQLASRCTDEFKTYIAGQHWFMTVNGKNYSCKCHGAWGGHRTCAVKDT